jgi:hypothetical protein
MIRNLKTLGLALVAVFAVSAMAASAARAVTDDAQLTAESFPAVFDGTQNGVLVFNREGRTMTCTTAEFHSEVKSTDSKTTITVKPTYSGCHSNIPLIGVVPMTVTMNGCDYLLHLTKDTPSGTFTADTTITCPPNKEIEVHVYQDHANHTSNTSLCTKKYPAQNPGGTIDLTNKAAGGTTPKDYLELDINISGMTSSITPAGAICGVAHNATGTLTGNATLKGTTAVGASQGLTVSTDVETP